MPKSKMRGRPPKKWFYRCVKAVSDKTSSPQRLCGWIYHHYLKTETVKSIKRAAGKPIPKGMK